MADMSTDAHKHSDPTTEPNPVYGMMKQGSEQSSYKNEQVGVCLKVDPHVTKAVGKVQKTYAHSHQSLSAVPQAPPTGRNMDVAREGMEGGVYESIPGDVGT